MGGLIDPSASGVRLGWMTLRLLQVAAVLVATIALVAFTSTATSAGGRSVALAVALVGTAVALLLGRVAPRSPGA